MSFPRRRLQLGLIVLAAVLIGLLVAEGLTRIFGWAPTVYRLRASEEKSAYRFSSNPVLGYLLKANYRDDDDPDLQNSFTRTNSHGFRDRERTLAKPAGVKRILMVGDSVVVGHGIRDLNDTISRKLEVILSPHQVEVINLAVGGYCTASEIELLATRGLPFSPDLVILLFTENDYLDRNTLMSLASPGRPRWAEALFVHSHLFRRLAITTNLFEFREATEHESIVKRHRHSIEKNNVVGALERLVALSKTEGFAVLIAVWPTFVDGEIADRHTMNDQPDVLFVEVVSKDYGLPCIRLSPWFREDQRERGGDPEELYTIGDGMHPSLLGAEIGARAIAAILDSEPQFIFGR